MKTEQFQWSKEDGWKPGESALKLKSSADLVFMFGARPLFEGHDLFDQVRSLYPKATVVGCTTAGEICGTRVTDGRMIVTAVQLERTKIDTADCILSEMVDSFQAGVTLARKLTRADLVHVLVLSDGLKVNGSELVTGITSQLTPSVSVTGGLAGDGSTFGKTFIHLNGSSREGRVVAIGFYGSHLKVGLGSMGGWDTYGIVRKVTKSAGNVLYQLDDQPALDFYKKYLGEKAAELPSSALLFPLSLRRSTDDPPLVRTVLSVDEQQQSMTFAGDVPQGSYVQFMKANFDRLVDGAAGAADTSYKAIGGSTPDLAILISCVGRKLVLKQRTEEETEAVQNVLGKTTTMTGFYSYGEISPFTPNAKCELHNQTMTITTLSEVE